MAKTTTTKTSRLNKLLASHNARKGAVEVLEDFDSFGGFEDDFDLAALRGSARRSEGAGEFVRKNPYMIGL